MHRQAEGSKKYKSDNFHQPKIRKVQLDTLKAPIHFGTSFASDNPITMGSYKTYEQHQCKNRSLCSHGLLKHILHHLENDNTESFVLQV